MCSFLFFFFLFFFLASKKTRERGVSGSSWLPPHRSAANKIYHLELGGNDQLFVLNRGRQVANRNTKPEETPTFAVVPCIGLNLRSWEPESLPSHIQYLSLFGLSWNESCQQTKFVQAEKFSAGISSHLDFSKTLKCTIYPATCEWWLQGLLVVSTRNRLSPYPILPHTTTTTTTPFIPGINGSFPTKEWSLFYR